MTPSSISNGHGLCLLIAAPIITWNLIKKMSIYILKESSMLDCDIVVRDFKMQLLLHSLLDLYLPNPSTRAGYDTRSILGGV